MIKQLWPDKLMVLDTQVLCSKWQQVWEHLNREDQQAVNLAHNDQDRGGGNVRGVPADGTVEDQHGAAQAQEYDNAGQADDNHRSAGGGGQGASKVKCG